MARRKNLTVVIGLLIVIVAMLIGAALSAMIPPQTQIADAAATLAPLATSGPAAAFGPVVAFGSLII